MMSRELINSFLNQNVWPQSVTLFYITPPLKPAPRFGKKTSSGNPLAKAQWTPRDLETPQKMCLV